MARIEGYGVRLYRNGVDFRSDRRPRVRSKAFAKVLEEVPPRRPGPRGEIKAFSRASQRRLAFVFANAGTLLRSLVTLTYHAVAESWEAVGDRNRRIVQRSKRDLNRFLTAMRRQLGAYLWVQELVGFKFKGGVLIDWRGETCARSARALVELGKFYGRTESLDELLSRFGWESVRDE
jgi:hypothetical protein